MSAIRDFYTSIFMPDRYGRLAGVAIIAKLVRREKAGKHTTYFKHFYVRTIDEAISQSKHISTNLQEDAYCAVVQFTDVDEAQNTGNRVGPKAIGACCFWLDIDVGDTKVKEGKGYATLEEAGAALKAFCRAVGLPKPSLYVCSGYGLHIYWLMDEFATRERWIKAAENLKALTLAKGFLVDQSRTADIASVLRPVGTLNYKNPDDPQPVAVLYPKEGQQPQRFDLAEFEAKLDAAAQALPRAKAGNLTGSAPKGLEAGEGNLARELPPSSALEINKQCATLAHVAEVRGKVSEPLWHAALGVWKHTTEGEAICHELSKGDPRYDEAETQRKIDRWTYGPTRCDNFQGMMDAKCAGCQQTCTSPISLGRAAPTKVTLVSGGVTIDQFRAFMPMHQYIFMPACDLWPAASINARFGPIPLLDDEGKQLVDAKGKKTNQFASSWLDQNRAVEQMTWAPGEPKLIENRLVANGGWMPLNGATVFNQYIPPRVLLDGDPDKAGPWLNHILRVYPDEAEHIINWLAHRVQHPGEKINHALLLGGAQGIGKDTILEPAKTAVGPWNFQEISPKQLLGEFNGYLKSVILRVSEARDLGDVDRFQFYEHMKTYTASPPDVLRINEKHLREYYIFNVCGVIITTNHKTNGIFLPADDRRHYVAWSERNKEDFPASYWNTLYAWYATGGLAHVAAYLSRLDISAFDPKAPPKKTPAFWAIADANRAPEDAELADTLEKLKWPDAVTLNDVKNAASLSQFYAWLDDRKNRRAIPHRMDKAGYVPVRNEADKSDGMWKVNGSRVVVYAKKTLSIADQITAATARTKTHSQ